MPELFQVKEFGWTVLTRMGHPTGVFHIVALQLILADERLVASIAFVWFCLEMFGFHVTQHGGAIGVGLRAAWMLAWNLNTKQTHMIILESPS